MKMPGQGPARRPTAPAVEPELVRTPTAERPFRCGDLVVLARNPATSQLMWVLDVLDDGRVRVALDCGCGGPTVANADRFVFAPESRARGVAKPANLARRCPDPED